MENTGRNNQSNALHYFCHSPGSTQNKKKYEYREFNVLSFTEMLVFLNRGYMQR